MMLRWRLLQLADGVCVLCAGGSAEMDRARWVTGDALRRARWNIRFWAAAKPDSMQIWRMVEIPDIIFDNILSVT